MLILIVVIVTTSCTQSSSPKVQAYKVSRPHVPTVYIRKDGSINKKDVQKVFDFIYWQSVILSYYEKYSKPMKLTKD